MTYSTEECLHENFNANVAVGRISLTEGGPVTHYKADITVECAECGMPFEFVGVPVGLSGYAPRSSFNCLELRAPIVPQGAKPPEGILGYGVSHCAPEEEH